MQADEQHAADRGAGAFGLMGLHSDFELDVQDMHPYLSLADMVYSVNISLRHKYVYVETPKCACTTIKLTLQRLELHDPEFDRIDSNNIHVREFSPLLNPKQVPSFRGLLKDERFTKVCFVRNPYRRLLSSYLDRIRGNRPQKAEVLRALGWPSNQLDREVSFDQFVDVVISQPIANMNSHWRIQYHQTMGSIIDYDLVGKFETLSEDITRFGAMISRGMGKYMPPVHYNKTNAEALIDRYMTPDIRDKIYRKFEIDFDKFEYKKEV